MSKETSGAVTKENLIETGKMLLGFAALFFVSWIYFNFAPVWFSNLVETSLYAFLLCSLVVIVVSPRL